MPLYVLYTINNQCAGICSLMQRWACSIGLFRRGRELSKLFLAAGCEAAMITIFTIGNSTCQRDSHLSNENCVRLVRSRSCLVVGCAWLVVGAYVDGLLVCGGGAM